MRVNPIRIVTDRLCQESPEWEHADLAGDAAAWREAGILKATGRYTRVRCTCGETHEAEVEDGFAYCSFTGHRFPVMPEDLLIYTFDPCRMVEVITELMRCREDPVEVIPSRLWKMGKAGVPIAGRSRDLFFAPRMTGYAQDIYDHLPDKKTPLLIVGSSHFLPDNNGKIDDNRIVMLDSVLSIEDGCLVLDKDWMSSLVSDAPEDNSTPKRRESSGETVERMERELNKYLEAAFRNYCEKIRKGQGRQMPEKRLTLAVLADMVGIDESWCSRLLELKKPIDQCERMELRLMWDSTQDIDYMVAYGKKHWGRKYKGWR